MSENLARQLFAQAEHLARKEPKRPQQASLRRSVSAAYYGLFHFLVDQACRQFFGTAHRDEKLRRLMSRGFQHGSMKEASKVFAGGRLPSWMNTTVPALTIPADLQLVSETFVNLQEERHRADYDLSAPFTKQETLRLLTDARNAVVLWNGIKHDEAARLYLLCLLSWQSLRGR